MPDDQSSVSCLRHYDSRRPLLLNSSSTEIRKLVKTSLVHVLKVVESSGAFGSSLWLRLKRISKVPRSPAAAKTSFESKVLISLFAPAYGRHATGDDAIGIDRVAGLGRSLWLRQDLLPSLPRLNHSGCAPLVVQCFVSTRGSPQQESFRVHWSQIPRPVFLHPSHLHTTQHCDASGGLSLNS